MGSRKPVLGVRWLGLGLRSRLVSGVGGPSERQSSSCGGRCFGGGGPCSCSGHDHLEFRGSHPLTLFVLSRKHQASTTDKRGKVVDVPQARRYLNQSLAVLLSQGVDGLRGAHYPGGAGDPVQDCIDYDGFGQE